MKQAKLIGAKPIPHSLTVSRIVATLHDIGTKMQVLFDVPLDRIGELKELTKKVGFATRETSGWLPEETRVKVVHGLIKCTPVHLQYQGTDADRPIATYENGFLVRLFVRADELLMDHGITSRWLHLRVLA